MSSEKKFDIWDIITLVKIYLPKLFIFTFFYFFLIFFIDNKLKDLSKEYKILNVEITVTNLDQLPKHYLNLDNIIVDRSISLTPPPIERQNAFFI